MLLQVQDDTDKSLPSSDTSLHSCLMPFVIVKMNIRF